MLTEIKEKDGNVISYLTQQLGGGETRVIVGEHDAFAVRQNEQSYHREIRRNAIKAGCKLLGHTELTIKSKYPINKFEV